MPKPATSFAQSGWLEATSGIVALRSPRRCRHSRSTRQWSSLDTRTAIRFGAAVGEAPLHVEALADLLRERAAQRVEVAAGEVELHAHEELATLGVGRVLVGADDVRSGVGEEAGDRGDDAVAVVAGDQQVGRSCVGGGYFDQRVPRVLGLRMAAAARSSA